MSDVLFDSGKYTLRPLAREKLAKISGIVLAYPSLKLAVEGNTDSVGTEAFNQHLSEQRAEGVRTYLTQQGVPEVFDHFDGLRQDSADRVKRYVRRPSAKSPRRIGRLG